ncbi:unnamed protein product [Schistocephalus solidus]|uniref:G protein-coupled receptor n=1 Tax=Schistocephalus solidus TaxID=70667 RepID=A0A183TBU2_SCHSO|nr:unnamed protein product [Schistocephalus solidus]
MMIEIFGCIANLTVTVLLFLLRGKKYEGLALLRVLSFSCLIAAVISFIYEIVEPIEKTGNVFFDGMICIFWSTRFVFWYSKAHVYHSLFSFAFYRAFEMLKIKNYLIIPAKKILIGYVIMVFICSFLSTAPFLLLAQPHLENCACAPPTKTLWILTMSYTHAFLWVAILAVIYPALLVYICIALFLKLRRAEGSKLVDDLDQLFFPEERESSSITGAISVSSPVHPDVCHGTILRAAAPQRVEDVFTPHVWSASFCIIPLTAAYIATFTYDATYQLLGAVGYLSYALYGSAHKFGELLLVLFFALVPMIIFFHIPALRSLIFVSIALIQKRRRKVRLMDVGAQPS